MAFTVSFRRSSFSVLILLFMPAFFCYSGYADGEDPTEITARALVCFSNKYIYSRCADDYRLSQHGNLDVPPSQTDEFCNGPCMDETRMLLRCINNIMDNFVFYNGATIPEVSHTLQAGCGDDDRRGDFNVEDYVQRETDSSHRLLGKDRLPLYAFILTLGLLQVAF